MKGRASDQRRAQPLVRAALFVASAHLISTSGPLSSICGGGLPGEVRELIEAAPRRAAAWRESTAS
jgi:hypothetical protein